MKTAHALRAMALAALLLGAAGAPTLAPAQQTIASKIELQGAPAWLQFTGLRMRQQNGMLQVQAELSNQNSGQQIAFYRVQWLDDTGFQVWEDEAWKPLLINGEQKLTLQMAAPTNKARDFRIQFSATDNKSRTGNPAP